MPPTRPTLAHTLRAAIAKGMAELHVALPGRVESYDPKKQRADVQPLIRRGYVDETGERQAESLPVIPDVPVVFPGAGGFRVTFPLKRGDTVLLVFADASLDKWLQHGGEVDPGDDRHHTLSDAVAIPGLRAFSETSPADGKNVVIETETEIHAGGNEALTKHSELEALKDVFSNWTPVAQDGGSALKTLLTALINQGWPSGTSVLKGK